MRGSLIWPVASMEQISSRTRLSIRRSLISGISPPVQLLGELPSLVGLYGVSNLDVVEGVQPDAALEPFLHLARVVLEALQGGNLALEYLDALPDQADVRVAPHLARHDLAAGDHADLGDLEDVA